MIAELNYVFTIVKIVEIDISINAYYAFSDYNAFHIIPIQLQTLTHHRSVMLIS